jgi:hypothetical protein
MKTGPAAVFQTPTILEASLPLPNGGGEYEHPCVVVGYINSTLIVDASPEGASTIDLLSRFGSSDGRDGWLLVRKSGSPSTRSAAGPLTPASSADFGYRSTRLLPASDSHRLPCGSNASRTCEPWCPPKAKCWSQKCRRCWLRQRNSSAGL